MPPPSIHPMGELRHAGHLFTQDPKSQGPAVCAWVHIAFICFRIDPNEADLILQSRAQITQLLPAAVELMGFWFNKSVYVEQHLLDLI